MTTASPVPTAFRYTLNGQDRAINDSIPLGRQLLTAGGFVPADDHVLIELLAHRTRSVGLDEQVDLSAPGREHFRAFRSDRLYVFTVDGNGYEWGTSTLMEAELRQLAGVASTDVLLLERSDGPDKVLAAGTAVDLSNAGTERLRTASRLVRVSLDDTIEKEIPRGAHSTEQLLALLGVTPGYLLNLLDHNGQLQPLAPGHTTHVKEGMKFYSQAPCGGAS